MTTLAPHHASLVSTVAAWAVSLSITVDELTAWPAKECNKRMLDMLPEAEKNIVRQAWADRRKALTRSTRRATA